MNNASSNGVAIGYLKIQLQLWGNSVCDNQYMHLRCVVHILNLVVRKGLEDVSQSVARVRALVKWVNVSPSRLKKFKDCVEIEKIENKSSLVLDISTRWNSTYLMLNVAQHFASAFNRLGIKDDMFKKDIIKEVGWPTVDDWSDVRRIVNFLKYFYELTLRISWSSYVTSNGFFLELAEVDAILKKSQNDRDDRIKEIATKMKSKLDEYWGDVDKMNKLLYVAIVFDPRHKFTFVEFAFKHMYDSDIALERKMTRSVKNTLTNMFTHYSIKYSSCPNYHKLQAEVEVEVEVGTVHHLKEVW